MEKKKIIRELKSQLEVADDYLLLTGEGDDVVISQCCQDHAIHLIAAYLTDGDGGRLKQLFELLDDAADDSEIPIPIIPVAPTKYDVN